MSGERRSQGGFILVAVLWMLVILTVLTMGFAHRVMLERRSSRYNLDREQAQAMARGAVYRGILEMENKPIFDEMAKEVGITSSKQRWARPINLMNEADFYPHAKNLGMEQDVCWVVIEDCDSRISLNTAPLELLESSKVVKGRAVNDLEERRMSDSQFGPHSFVHRDEMLSVGDVAEDDWFGTRGGLASRDLFTVWGDSRGAININTASPEVLSAIPDLENEVLNALIAFRNGDDELFGTADDRLVRDLARLAGTLGVSAEKVGPLQKYCKIDSQFFTIRTTATLRGMKIRAYCEVVVEYNSGEVVIQDWSEVLDAA